jgi:4-hydroxy-2-oxoglutarate aldolase
MPLPTRDPIVVAPSPTPFREDDAVDHAAIERNVERWLETPLSGFMLNSENGEETFLSEAERLEIVRTVHRVCRDRKFIVGGIDIPSVRETLRLAEALVAVGAELIRLRIPRDPRIVRDYFREVVPRCPVPVVIIHQMAPGTFLSVPTPIGAPAPVIGELVEMENVFGYIASADVRFESRTRLFVPVDKRFWTPNGSLLLAGAVLGANGASMMLGNVAPRECLEILEHVRQGRLAEAQALQARLLEVDWQILSRGAAGLKAALNLLGFETGHPRRPQAPCSAAEMAEIRDALRNAELL